MAYRIDAQYMDEGYHTHTAERARIIALTLLNNGKPTTQADIVSAAGLAINAMKDGFNVMGESGALGPFTGVYLPTIDCLIKRLEADLGLTK